jgi:hypothetical protein
MLLKLGRGYLVDRRKLLKGSYYAAFNVGEKLLFLFAWFFGGGWGLNSVLHTYKSRRSTT